MIRRLLLPLHTRRAVCGAVLAWTAAAVLLAQTPPATRRDDIAETLHGVDVVDPYRWLEDQEAPATRAWIDGQNAYTRTTIGLLPGRGEIERRITELLKIETRSVPFGRGGRYFFTKRGATQDLAVLCMRDRLRGTDQVLVDPHGLSPDHTISVNFLDVSDDGRLLAYGVRSGGEDEVIVRLFDVDRRRNLLDTLPKGRYSGVSINQKKTGLYYSRHTPDGPRVFYHVVGDSASSDRELFGKGYGPEKIISARLSDDRRYLLITVSHGSAARKSEVYIQDVKSGASPSAFKTIVNNIDATFTATIGGDLLFLRTNWNAPNFKVMAVDLRNPARERWRPVIPAGKTVITSITAAGGRLLVSHLDEVQPRLRLYTSQGRRVGELPLRSIGSVGSINGDWDQDEVFFSFSSFAQPTTIHRYDLDSSRQEVWSRLSVPVSSGNIDVQQVWYSSKDGTKIPMFIAHRSDVKLDGANPTLLTGYGGFNVSQLPAFSPRAMFWIEHGGVYALPNLRGGGEFGEAWHRAGMMERKQNVFDDFIAAAEWLIEKRYTTPSKLAISGGSNGGLLVGAALTERPELFQAVVCSYPLLDMVRYHRFLVARFWVPEYGSSENEAEFRYLYAYSPYHRVSDGARYPAVLLISGDADTRVAPLHARKMTARLQAATRSLGRPILLKYDTKAGHSGGLPVTKTIEDLTDELLFLGWQLGTIRGATTNSIGGL